MLTLSTPQLYQSLMPVGIPQPPIALAPQPIFQPVVQPVVQPIVQPMVQPVVTPLVMPSQTMSQMLPQPVPTSPEYSRFIPPTPITHGLPQDAPPKIYQFYQQVPNLSSSVQAVPAYSTISSPVQGSYLSVGVPQYQTLSLI